jgi:hypothetical protein
MQRIAPTVSDTLSLLAIVAVGLCLVPAGAHLFELPNKMALPQPQYMTVQRIYAGWALFGIVILAAIVLTATHAILTRRKPRAFALSLAALVLLVASQAVFWLFTYPMNVASSNWTVTPEHFEAARRQWEYSHAANAVITFVAFVAITLAALAARTGDDQALPST